MLAVALGPGNVAVVRQVSSRETLARALFRLLAAANDAGLRVLFGQDHQYGIPAALAEELGLPTGSWREAMGRLFLTGPFSERAKGGEAGAFAADVNKSLGTRGLSPYFWTATKKAYGIPGRNPRDTGHPTQRRLTEVGAGFPFCRVGDNGSVGGQSIVGIPRLLGLLADCEREGIPVKVWPFDALDVDELETHVAIEPYPSLVREAGIVQSDANDAIASATWAQRLDRAGSLREALDLRNLSSADHGRVRFEGWMAGMPIPT